MVLKVFSPFHIFWFMKIFFPLASRKEKALFHLSSARWTVQLNLILEFKDKGAKS